MTGQIDKLTTPMKILLVDDHILFREGLVSLLSTQVDMDVVGWANNSEEAVERAREFRPELILMDYSLPEGTGLEAMKTILAERPEVKIVLLTIHPDDKRLFAAMRAGAGGYLPKSVSAARLMSYLRGVVQGNAAVTPSMTGRVLDRPAETEPRESASHSVVANLTAREGQVLQELATGASNREIADRLIISEQTVKNHVSRILAKLGLNSRYAAADIAREIGIASAPLDQ